MKPYRLIAIFAGIVMLWTLTAALRSIMEAKPAIADLANLPTIVIDPGHGGVDGGAVGRKSNIIEKDINLAISLTLRDIFIVNGFDVVMTRETDVSIHDEEIDTIRKQKTSDLKNRLAIVDSYPNAILISVHQNNFTSSGPRGTQIFYSPNNPRSEELASILQSDFINTLQPENKRKHKKAGKNLYLMYNSKCPAVLIECGFLSNSDEAGMLIQPEYQSKLAFTAFCSVMRFLGLDDISIPDSAG